MCGCSSDAIVQFEKILKQYIFPLFPIDQEDERSGIKTVSNKKPVSALILLRGKGSIFFYPCKDQPMIYYRAQLTTEKVSLTAARLILKSLMENSEYLYSYKDHNRKRIYGSNRDNKDIFLEQNLKLAYEIGLCDWCGGNAIAGKTIYYLLSQLEVWATKTYEGKRTSFGFIVDSMSEEGDFDYLDFLKTNTSAVFTDGTAANVLIDKYGKLVKYQTVSDFQIEKNQKEPFCPMEFTNFTNCCFGNMTGLLLLNTGDILIIKSKKLVFAKRHSNWIYYDFNCFQQIVSEYIASSGISEKNCTEFINSLYLTVLDVSFSHTGGCIALVDYEDFDSYKDCIKNDILDETLTESLDSISLNFKIKQRKAAIRSFVKGRDFYNVERKLRHELVSLDGATVINNKGKIIASGSIVKINGGSEDGGRTAATRHMAQYGFSIKISEDGQIYCYGRKNNKSGQWYVEELLRFY